MPDLSSQKIEFDEESHIYRVGGSVIPSVTQVLEMVGITDYSDIPENILEEKRLIGTAVHEMTRMDDEDDLGTFDPDLSGYLESWRKVRDKYQMVFKAIERMVYHPVFGFCGTLDRWPVMVYGGKVIDSILDLKTGLVDLCAVGPQTAGYEMAIRYELKLPPMHRFAVKLFEDGREGLLIPCSNKLDFEVFKNAVSVVNWRNQKHRRF